MCLRPSALQPIPQLTTLAAHAAFPKGNAYLQIRHVATAARINLTRVANWLSDRPRARTHVPAFVALALAA